MSLVISTVWWGRHVTQSSFNHCLFTLYYYTWGPSHRRVLYSSGKDVWWVWDTYLPEIYSTCKHRPQYARKTKQRHVTSRTRAAHCVCPQWVAVWVDNNLLLIHKIHKPLLALFVCFYLILLNIEPKEIEEKQFIVTATMTHLITI